MIVKEEKRNNNKMTIATLTHTNAFIIKIYITASNFSSKQEADGSTTSMGKQFQSLVVFGKKDIL